MVLLTEAQLEERIDARYQRRGDVLCHMERRPHYDVPSQNRDRDNWLAGRPDTTELKKWAQVLADDQRRGLVSRRARVLSAELTDDEAMSCDIALPVISPYEEVRVLHRGEHPVPDLVPDDYWVMRPATGGIYVIRNVYDDGGAFLGAEEVPASEHARYLRDWDLSWVIGEDYPTWWGRRTDLHRRPAAA